MRTTTLYQHIPQVLSVAKFLSVQCHSLTRAIWFWAT